MTQDDISNLEAGDYMVVITATVTLGPLTLSVCTFDSILTVTQPDSMTISAQVDSALCNAENTGAINLSVSGRNYSLFFHTSGLVA